MIYDLYYHDDFDGRAAGALMLAFLRSRGDDIEHFQPLDYYLIDDYLKENFFTAHKLFKGKRNPAIVVDFPFHPKAVWWFDHHGGPFRRKGWKEKFKPSKFLHHNPEYASCCKQVAEVLKKEFGWKAPAHMKEMIVWGDILDGAKYKSARQTMEMKESALQISLFFDQYGKLPVANKTFITLLAEQSLAKIAKRQEVRHAVRKAKKDILGATKYVKKNVEINRRVAYIYFEERAHTKPRYIPYALHPRLLYLVRVFKKGKEYHLSVGQNPWRKKENKIDLGKLVARYGGGGHFGVGAAEMKTKQEAEIAAREIVDILLKQTSHHGRKI